MPTILDLRRPLTAVWRNGERLGAGAALLLEALRKAPTLLVSAALKHGGGTCPDATVDRPDLATWVRLDELGLEVVGQRLESERAVLACRLVSPTAGLVRHRRVKYVRSARRSFCAPAHRAPDP